MLITRKNVLFSVNKIGFYLWVNKPVYSSGYRGISKIILYTKFHITKEINNNYLYVVYKSLSFCVFSTIHINFTKKTVKINIFISCNS